MAYKIIEHTPTCFEIVGTHPDGLIASLGVYSTRRDALGELALIREAG